jgi:hypothetical protein
MRFNLCAGFINGLVFACGIAFIFCNEAVPLFIDVLLLILSSFVMGVLLGEEK